MFRKINVSIGIPAYNEEANIKILLQNLLEQKNSNFNLKEIIVVSDASSDNTDMEVLSLRNPVIKLVRHKTRKGQAVSQNEILKLFKEEVLVLLNADILPSNDKFLENIIQPFINEKNVGIVGGTITPLTAKNFFEKIINYSVAMKKSLYEEIHNGDNVFLCHGRVRAFSRKFANEFKWMQVVTEDAYSYLVCIEKGYLFVYAPDAEVLYCSPSNFKDHISQSARFLQSQVDLKQFIDHKIIDKAYTIPLVLQLKMAILGAIKQPVLFTSYIFILMISKIISWKFFTNSLIWTPSQSSKILNLTANKKTL